jgi:hypothetical protein
MGPIAYSLCQKPVLGLVMFLASACAFPPLVDQQALPLQQADARVVTEFEAPVGKTYFLELTFHDGATYGVRSDDIAGSWPYQDCSHDYAAIPAARRATMGPPIPLHVLVREKRTGKVRIDQVFNVQCAVSWGFEIVTRTAARVTLPAGTYVLEVRNLQSQPWVGKVRTTVSLGPGHMK